MAISLQKGQRINLGLSKVALGLGWDPNEGTGGDFDLDVSAFCVAANGKIPEDGFFIFYNNKYSPDGAVEGADDDTTGRSSDGDDDETVKVDLTKVDSRIEEIVLVVTVHDAESRNQNFGQVRNSYIRLVDTAKNEEIAMYELEEDFSTESAVEFGRLYKKRGEWKFQAVGTGYQGGLEYFLNKYN